MGNFLTSGVNTSNALQIIAMNYEFSIKPPESLKKPQNRASPCGIDRAQSARRLHHCINALTEQGYVKTRNFKNAQNKLVCTHMLPPSCLIIKNELHLVFFVP